MTTDTDIKTRRLDAEIKTLKNLRNDIKNMIKYDPYKEDLPGLKKQLAEVKADLKSAEREMVR